MINGKQKEGREQLFGFASMACIASVVIVYRVTEPLLSHLVVWWGRLLIYLAVPILAVFTVLYRSSGHEERPRARRIRSMILSALLVLATVMFFFLVLGLGWLVIAMFMSNPSIRW